MVGLPFIEWLFNVENFNAGAIFYWKPARTVYIELFISFFTSSLLHIITCEVVIFSNAGVFFQKIVVQS